MPVLVPHSIQKLRNKYQLIQKSSRRPHNGFFKENVVRGHQCKKLKMRQDLQKKAWLDEEFFSYPILMFYR